VLLISTTHQPATDLGFLLHKNPSRNFAADLNFGRVRVVFPEAGEARTTAALIVELDPVALVRKKGDAQGSAEQYVNDRPYTANSFVSVALVEAFGTAMGGRSKERQELAETAIPLELRIPVLRVRGGEEMLRRLFEPLGYSVEAKQVELDETFPEWGLSPYFDVTLRGTQLLRDALRHLYILFPVLDAKKHYFMDSAEVDKIISKGEGWLENHPERHHILRTSLGRKPSLVYAALEQLTNAEVEVAEPAEESAEEFVPKPEKRVSLHTQRHNRVLEVVRELRPRSVVDLGCGEGKLLRELIKVQGIERILGLEVSYYTLESAIRKLHLEEGGSRYGGRLELIHGSLMYRDKRIAGFDVATVIEVIEHMDAGRLHAFERVLFEYAKPRVAIVTTPNREYNVLYAGLEELRHSDHRFEWARVDFEAWASGVCSRHGYSVKFEGIGDADETHGSPSQMAVFSR
jgi:3' terminal RNA ribose 2'-O-methyltransferase Hen1